MRAAAICPEVRPSVRVMMFGGAWMSYRQLIGAWLTPPDASLMISRQQLLSGRQSPPSAAAASSVKHPSAATSVYRGMSLYRD